MLLTGVIKVLILISRSSNDLSLRGWHIFLTSMKLGHVLMLISVGLDFHCIYLLPKEGSLLKLGISHLSIDMRSGKGASCSIIVKMRYYLWKYFPLLLISSQIGRGYLFR